MNELITTFYNTGDTRYNEVGIYTHTQAQQNMVAWDIWYLHKKALVFSIHNLLTVFSLALRQNLFSMILQTLENILANQKKKRKKNPKPMDIKQIRPEFSLEAKVTRLQLSNFTHIMQRACSLKEA